jgi:tetratricopeptide (TPR) repeat protein
MKSGRIFFELIFLLMAACPALAQEVGKVMSIVGTAEVLRKERWQSVSLHETLQAGDIVRTGPGSRVAVLLADGSQLKVNANSQLLLKQVASPTRHVAMQLIQSLLRLFRGEIWVRSLGEPLEIETLAAVATIRGTELNLAVEPVEAARLTVVEGVVELRNSQGSVLVAAKEQAIAKPGEAPRKVVIINPRDAVQWALYYPPLIDYRQVSYPEGPDAQAIRRALEHYRRGALPETLRSLEQVSPERRDARFFTLRAGLLLSVSQVVEARADIEETLRRNPSEATAHALRSIIALVQNQKEKALRLARQAVELELQSPVPQVALSYAYQATFDLDKALKSLEQAAKLAPEDALIQARLAELELSRGELERALKAAQKAVALDPELARTQTVLGFAYLTQIRIAQAKSAFERAITLDSADPLPRLGLGLAKIRESNLTEGAREIEIAASLDPNNALIRSYLGKAYYEEKREGLAAREFAIAKELDPKDPTPWFYDAIHKQLENQPVEALQDLQKSIALNDNRAVYRSRLLLDDDLAARSASLSRIYRDLGFEQLALVEGWKSVNTDPAEHSAHRLLADSYSVLPRHEIARVSELLQSQLLQPLNVTPVQPQLAESNLFILEGAGPAAPAFNEFNPLFTRNRLTLQASGIYGSNDTWGDEIVHSGIWDRFSYSVGQFHYETEGFRPNNHVRQDLVNGFFQASLSPKLSVQAEVRHKEVDIGDIDLFADDSLNRFDRAKRREISTDTVRAGGHYALNQGSDFIASFIHQEGDNSRNSGVAKFSTFGDLGEAQYLFRSEYFSAIAGIGYSDSGFAPVAAPQQVTSTTHGNGYLYSFLTLPRDITWIFGVSVDSFQNDLGTRKQVNPKLGLIWRATPITTIRLGAFRTLKRSLLTNQTIEPTQVAGFNQFFDDITGTDSRRIGIAVDHKFHAGLYGGLEFSARELRLSPVSGLNNSLWDERSYRAYVHWAPHPKLSAKLTYELDEFEGAEFTSGIGISEDTSTTHIAEAALRFFDPSGVFARVATTYVNQEAASRTLFNPPSRENEFILLNAGIGYRLPKRLGILGVEAKNLFDEEFNFQSLGARTIEGQNLPFIPDRTIFTYFTLAF